MSMEPFCVESWSGLCQQHRFQGLCQPRRLRVPQLLRHPPAPWARTCPRFAAPRWTPGCQRQVAFVELIGNRRANLYWEGPPAQGASTAPAEGDMEGLKHFIENKYRQPLPSLPPCHRALQRGEASAPSCYPAGRPPCTKVSAACLPAGTRCTATWPLMSRPPLTTGPRTLLWRSLRTAAGTAAGSSAASTPAAEGPSSNRGSRAERKKQRPASSACRLRARPSQSDQLSLQRLQLPHPLTC